MQQEGNSAPRWHRPAGGGGGLWSCAQHALAQGLTNWVTSMAAHDLIIENGRVAGVVAVHQETGEEQTFLARTVIWGQGIRLEPRHGVHVPSRPAPAPRA